MHTPVLLIVTMYMSCVATCDAKVPVMFTFAFTMSFHPVVDRDLAGRPICVHMLNKEAHQAPQLRRNLNPSCQRSDKKVPVLQVRRQQSKTGAAPEGVAKLVPATNPPAGSVPYFKSPWYDYVGAFKKGTGGYASRRGL